MEDADAAGFVFDEDAAQFVVCVPAQGFVGDGASQLGELEALPTGIAQEEAVIVEEFADGEGAGVVLFGILEGGVPGEPTCDDALRFGIGPVAPAPPVGLVDAAGERGWALGVLTGVGAGAEIKFGGGVFRGAEAGGPEQFAGLGAWVVESDGGDVALWFVFGGEAEVFVIGCAGAGGVVLFEQVSGEVVRVEALHDDDTAGEARVVGAGGEGGVVGVVDAVAVGWAVGVLGFERVVDDEDVGAFTGDGGVEAEGEAVAGFVVVVAVFGVLVGGEGEEVSEVLAVPGAEDQAAADGGVAGSEGDGVGAGEPAEGGVFDPAPGGPEDADEEAFHVAGWDVDDEVADLVFGDGLEVFADDLDVPVVDEGGGGLDDVPGLVDVGVEVVGAGDVLSEEELLGCAGFVWVHLCP